MIIIEYKEKMSHNGKWVHRERMYYDLVKALRFLYVLKNRPDKFMFICYRSYDSELTEWLNQRITM